MRILVECYPDETLLRTLGVPRKQLRHERCKGEVVKRVLKFDCATGVIDEDPASAQPRELDNYKEVRAAEGLRLLARRDDKNKRLIIICPRLEDWLLQRAGLSGIEPEDYGVLSQPNHLHSIPRYERTDGFQRFLSELKEQDKGMHLLHRWVLEGES
jgi:hypothetical protein